MLTSTTACATTNVKVRCCAQIEHVINLDAGDAIMVLGDSANWLLVNVPHGLRQEIVGLPPPAFIRLRETLDLVDGVQVELCPAVCHVSGGRADVQ